MTTLAKLTLAWVLGILVAAWVSPSVMRVLWIVLSLCVGLLFLIPSRQIRQLIALSIALLLGIIRLQLSIPNITPSHIAYYNDNGYATVRGKIIAEPDIRDGYTNLRVKAETLTPQNGETHPVDGLVLVRAETFPTYHFGDTIDVFAQPETPPVFDDFSYQAYLAQKNIHSMMRRPHIKLVAAHNPFSLRSLIFDGKAYAHRTIGKILAEPAASLLSGILLGIRSGIPPDLYEKFNTTGTSHVIVISGSNISLVVALALLVGQRLFGKRKATWLALISVTFYTVMVGADPAVVRAAIMGTLFVLSMASGRPNMMINTLFGSAFLMTFVNPLTLWDVGFQLSFMATLGLIVLVPPLERITTHWLSGFGGMNSLATFSDVIIEAFLVTLAAQIATLPLIVYHFGRFSLVSIFANLLIVPARAMVMLSGGLATFLGMLWLPLGTAAAWLAWLPLAWTVWIVEWSASLSWAHLRLPAMPLWLLIISYLALLAGLYWLVPKVSHIEQSPHRQRASKNAFFALGGVAVIAILLWSATRSLPDGNLHVNFLDIGQGDAILVTTPDGKQILIDGGPSATILAQRLGENMPFWDHSLDMIVSTHPDSDHLTGLVDVLMRYDIGAVLESDIDGTSALYETWKTWLYQPNMPVETVARAGMRLQLDDEVWADVFNPSPNTKFFPSPNNHSVTMKIQMGKISFLLSGDLEAEGEATLLKTDMPVNATVLKSPHHGSNTGSSVAFLEAVNPQLIVISVGADNHFGHPAPKILARYADMNIPVLRTDKQGSIELVTDGNTIWMETN